MPRKLLKGNYYVEKIVGKRVNQGQVQYWVKWKGYSQQQKTWEPLENIKNYMKLVDKFEASKIVIKSKQSSVQQLQVQKLNPPAPKPPKQIKKLKRLSKVLEDEKERRVETPYIESLQKTMTIETPQKPMAVETSQKLIARETPQKPMARELERAQRLDEAPMSKLRIRKILTILSKGGAGEAMYEVDFQIQNGIQPLPTVLSEGEISSLDPAKLIDFYRDLYEQVNS